MSLFGAEAPKAAKTARGRVAKPARSGEERPHRGLNGAQRTAASAEEATVAVLAGPGTGKTHTLVERVVWLVEERGPSPRSSPP
ncbi:MAG: UvrD-helicase domain-containing protein [Flavonifractor plautii]